ncbi:hypothetical protein ONS95_007246 [Cadophora gregata]|uniref:uncharacterized protein n=1 Tax=Cadophora gregata TaxID=51156 RepID=UPI0026DD9AA8|nr:uncharacterized protein ONS95_007246 [Cadophora gregata]KAK0100798.1 hypothetical protein ONS95_007246 [Cadophora gregata]KAK0117207.1 hypothetical protein ONS96_013041 [Cadophora gregata f. sp. sojae]
MEGGELVLRNPDLRQTIVDTLIDGAKGMFLWVRFQLNELCIAETDEAIKETLRDLPKDLTETYDRLLSRIEGSQRRELVIRMFRWITCARRPLIVDELCEGIAFGIDDTKWDINKIPTDFVRLIRACNHLVIINDETKTVQFAHYTVQQYILDNQAAKDMFFHFTDPEGQEALGETCVAYLNFSDFETQLGPYKNGHITPGIAAIERVVAGSDLGLPKNLSVDAMRFFSRITYGKASRPTNIDYARHIPRDPDPVEHLLERYRLLSYVREHWLWHAMSFTYEGHAENKRDIMYRDLLLEKHLPFSFRPWHTNGKTQGTYPYLEPIGWALAANHCSLIRAISTTEKTFEASSYFQHAAGWFFESSDDNFISQHMMDRLQDCTQNTGDPKSNVKLGWLYSRMLNACHRGNLDALVLCMPQISSTSGAQESPWVRIRGHLILEAARNNHTTIITEILGFHTSPDVGLYEDFTTTYKESNCNALEIAALSGHMESTQLLRHHGWHPSTLLASRGQKGIHQLDEAVRTCNLDVIATLLATLRVAGEYPHFNYLEEWKMVAFVSAASAGRLSAVRLFREWGLDPLSNGHGMCPFMRAIREGQAEVVEYLLDKDYELGVPGCGTETNIEGLPLGLAASMGHLKIADMLIKCGADTFSSAVSDYAGGRFLNHGTIEVSPTPLYAASANGHVEMVRYLLEHNACPSLLSPTGILELDSVHPDTVTIRRRIFYSDSRAEARDILSRIDVAYYQTPLLGATIKGQLEVVKILLQRQIDVNIKDSNGDSALFLAAAMGHREIMSALLRAGANIKDLAPEARVAGQLLKCAENPARAMGIKCLLELGVYPDYVNMEGQSSLFNAARTGSPESVVALLEAGADIERRDFKKNTPLLTACANDNAEALAILIRSGANLHVKSAHGQCLLHLACRRGNADMVKHILDAGIPVDTKDSQGYTALLANCDTGLGYTAVIELLVSRGADVNFCKTWLPGGRTPLMMAAQNGSESILLALIKAGARWDHADVNGKTALFAAASLIGNESAVQNIFDDGASASLTTKKNAGLSILSIALAARHEQLLQLLC